MEVAKVSCRKSHDSDSSVIPENVLLTIQRAEWMLERPRPVRVLVDDGQEDFLLMVAEQVPDQGS